MREAKEIVLLLDTDNTIVEANDFALGAYGYSRGELIGRSVDAYRVPQAEVTVADRTRQLEEKGGPLTFASLHRRRDGVEFPVEVSLSVLTIEGEKYYLEIVRDVGERVAAEAALRESEARYRTLFENSLSGFALHEVVLGENGQPVDYVFLAANPAFEEQSGLKVADVLGARATDVVSGLRETGLIERYGRVALTGEPQRFETYVPALGRHFDIQVVSPRPQQFATIFIDVTAAKRGERELEENKAFLEHILSVTPDRIYIFDIVDQRNLFSNREMLDALGYTPEEILEMGSEVFARILHPEDRQAVAEHRARARTLADGEVLEVEYRMRRADGEWRILHGRDAAFSRGEDGRVSQLVGTARDVTDQRRAEADLAQLSQRFEATVMSSPLAIVSLGVDWQVKLWNPAASAVFGWSAEEAVGHMARFIPPDSLEQAVALQRRLLGGERFSGLDLPCVRKDGRRIHTSLSLALMQSEDGTPDSVLMIVEDVTERRATVIRLARLTRLYQVLSAVMEAVPEEREPDRLYDKVCRIVVEQGGFRLAWVGRKRRDGRVRVLASAGVEGAADEIDDSIRPTPAGPSPVAVAIVEGRSDTCGEIAADPRMATYREYAEKWGLSSLAAVPIVVDGRHDTVLAIGSAEPGRFDSEEVNLLERLAADVGFGIEAAGRERARHKAERQLEALNADLERRVRARTDALEAANAELEAFSYSVSHDLRAPLRALDGFSLALLEDYGTGLDGDAADYLNRIRRASQRMARLIDDLLMLSRVTRRGMTWGRVDLSAAARSIGAELADDDPGRQVKLAVRPKMVADGDAQLLDVALRNLLDNAWKFTSRTAGARVEVGMEGDGEDRVFFVRDNGAGFDSQYADKLFAPFQRLHGDDEFPGTGIGLATVQRIVRRHGGRVWAEGTTGMGATVWFTLGSGGRVDEGTALDPSRRRQR